MPTARLVIVDIVRSGQLGLGRRLDVELSLGRLSCMLYRISLCDGLGGILNGTQLLLLLRACADETKDLVVDV